MAICSNAVNIYVVYSYTGCIDKVCANFLESAEGNVPYGDIIESVCNHAPCGLSHPGTSSQVCIFSIKINCVLIRVPVPLAGSCKAFRFNVQTAVFGNCYLCGNFPACVFINLTYLHR